MGKILFIRGGAVGDFILTMPAIKLVRDTLPDLEIEILGYPSISELAVAAGLADRTQSIEHATMAPFFAPGAKLDDETCRYFKQFDVVVSYLYDPDGFFCGNLEQAGVETLIPAIYKIDESEPYIPAAQQLAAPLEQLALFVDKPYIEISYGDMGDRDKNIVALHPGSGSASKNWSYENWAELANKIYSQNPATTFQIISGEAEGETVSDFLGLLTAAQIPFQHLNQVPLTEVGKQLQTAGFFLGHDSGISHLAASTGTPGLILSGPTNPKIWAPQHPAFSYIQAPGQQLGHLSVEQVWQEPSLQTFLA